MLKYSITTEIVNMCGMMELAVRYDMKLAATNKCRNRERNYREEPKKVLKLTPILTVFRTIFSYKMDYNLRIDARTNYQKSWCTHKNIIIFQLSWTVMKIIRLKSNVCLCYLLPNVWALAKPKNINEHIDCIFMTWNLHGLFSRLISMTWKKIRNFFIAF